MRPVQDRAEPLDGDPPWLTLALSHLGCQELLPSGALNPVVRAFFRVTTFPPQLINNRTAWCSAFACSMLEEAGYKSTRSAKAKSFLTWGRELVKLRRGAVLVFQRGPVQGEAGHVGFYLGDSGDHLLVLGGNQSNSVGPSRYARSKLLAVRWPSEKLLYKAGPGSAA